MRDYKSSKVYKDWRLNEDIELDGDVIELNEVMEEYDKEVKKFMSGYDIFDE